MYPNLWKGNLVGIRDEQFAIEHGAIEMVDLLNLKMVIFHSELLVYQRVWPWWVPHNLGYNSFNMIWPLKLWL